MPRTDFPLWALRASLLINAFNRQKSPIFIDTKETMWMLHHYEEEFQMFIDNEDPDWPLSRKKDVQIFVNALTAMLDWIRQLKRRSERALFGEGGQGKEEEEEEISSKKE